MSRPRDPVVGSFLLVLATATAGCVNFAEPRPGPGELEADLRIDDRDRTPRAEFDARFRPGAGRQGDVRSPVEAPVSILGTSIPPSDDSGPLELTYRRALDLEREAVDRPTVKLIGPRLGAERPAAVVAAPLVWRAGPDSVQLANGGDLELPLRGVPDRWREELERLRWTLTVRPSTGADEVFTASGAGSLPDTLAVESQMLGGPGDRPLEASVRVLLEAGSAPGETGYGATLRISVRLVWTVLPG